MTVRVLRQLLRAYPMREGAGVTVRRSIGSDTLEHLDPFLMLDCFGTDDPKDYIAGFPDHPHRGFVTLTYMLDGRMLHRDSMGNQGDLGPGGAQWMKAASGVIHSEMPQQSAGLMRGFQLWINLPAAEKMTEPAYQEIHAEAVPTVEAGGAAVKVLAGAFEGVQGPIEDPITAVAYFDVSLSPDSGFRHTLDSAFTAFIYVFEGGLLIAKLGVPESHLAVLGEGDEITLQAGPEGARFILVSGRPLQETVVKYGPFVMNTRQEVVQAVDDLQAGTLVRHKAQFAEKRS